MLQGAYAKSLEHDRGKGGGVSNPWATQRGVCQIRGVLWGGEGEVGMSNPWGPSEGRMSHPWGAYGGDATHNGFWSEHCCRRQWRRASEII